MSDPNIIKYKEQFKDSNFDVLGYESRYMPTNKKKYKIYLKVKCHLCGHIWESFHENLKSGKGCQICRLKNISELYGSTDEEAIDEFSKFDFKVIKLERIYDYEKSKLFRYITCRCNKDGAVWTRKINHLRTTLRKGLEGCPVCTKARQKIKNMSPEINKSFGDLNPNLVKYFVHKDEAYKYKPNSDAYVKVKCLHCESEKYVQVKHLNRYGFSCSKCSDTISMPEKFCINFLNSLGVEYIHQYKPKWSKGKIYDFYIPSMNMIIETHGITHYKTNQFGNIKSQVEIDTIKRNLAKDNGIGIYKEIDCRFSTYKHLSENFYLSTKDLFELYDIDFMDIWGKSIDSSISKSWDIWEKYNKSHMIKEMSKMLNIGRGAFISHLKIGVELGKCSYEPKGKGFIKPVYMYSLNNEFIEKFESSYDAGRKLGRSPCHISSCCRGKAKSAYGFIFKYSSPNN